MSFSQIEKILNAVRLRANKNFFRLGSLVDYLSLERINFADAGTNTSLYSFPAKKSSLIFFSKFIALQAKIIYALVSRVLKSIWFALGEQHQNCFLDVEKTRLINKRKMDFDDLAQGRTAVKIKYHLLECGYTRQSHQELFILSN